MKAIWNNTTIAESNETINIEGNQYFPANSIKKEYFTDSDLKSNCHWKGEASYYNIIVDGKKNENAAWYYPKTSQLAESIEGYIAFWKGVEVK